MILALQTVPINVNIQQTLVSSTFSCSPVWHIHWGYFWNYDLWLSFWITSSNDTFWNNSLRYLYAFLLKFCPRMFYFCWHYLLLLSTRKITLIFPRLFVLGGCMSHIVKFLESIKNQRFTTRSFSHFREKGLSRLLQKRKGRITPRQFGSQSKQSSDTQLNNFFKDWWLWNYYHFLYSFHRLCESFH